MKKTKNTKKQQKKSVPFTCVIKGEGVDIDITLPGGSVRGFATAIAESIAAKSEVTEEVLTQPSDDPKAFRAGTTLFLSEMSGEYLTIVGEVLAAEISRRAMANGANIPPTDAAAPSTSATA
jgi:hypothetical protein